MLRENVDVYSLFSFFTFRNFEFDVLSFFESAETLFVNACVVNKDVCSRFGCDETITFSCIKPFYCTFHKIKKLKNDIHKDEQNFWKSKVFKFFFPAQNRAVGQYPNNQLHKNITFFSSIPYN